MKRVLHFFLLSVLASFLPAQEPSAFSAGDMKAGEPYGLTQAEKMIHQNDLEIKELKKQLFSLRQRVDTIGVQMEGIKSVVEGIDERLSSASGKSGHKSMEAQIAGLRKDLNTTIEIQRKNNEEIKRVLRKLSVMVDKISSDYVSKAEFEKEMKKIYSLLGASAAKSRAGKASGEKKEIQATARGAGSKDLASLFTKARKSFWQGRYSEAKELFMQTAQAGYKPAMSYFYIGESCYYSKEYACAIENYKKSASLNQNASYMPTLLLHSGISMERLGQKDGARKFYELVVRLYPDTKAAKIAKERLQKL